MRTQKKHWIFTLTVTAMLSLATHSHALYTNYLDDAVATLTGASNYLASIPTPTKADKKHLAEVKKALKDLSKPSVSVAGDYNLFFAAVVHLGDLTTDPTFGPTLDNIGTNAFNAFISEAHSELEATGERISELNDFVGAKRAASNQWFKARATLISLASTTNKQVGLLLGRQLFARLAVANRLAANGEAHSGFALDSVVGKNLHHMEGTRSGTVYFNNNVDATQMETGGSPKSATYTYTRTGLTTATLVLMSPGGMGGTDTTTVKIHFTSAAAGTFTFRNVGSDGHVRTGTGTFTID